MVLYVGIPIVIVIFVIAFCVRLLLFERLRRDRRRP
jgi:hypothetical protein